ncbi:MAG: rRNA methyltransferase, partial [Ruaniaceae bacterium]|nr:rRNA methyltransferase [Ruaniaceae bacterium]
DSVALDEFSATLDDDARGALVLGAEGDGRSRCTIAACDAVVRIPMTGAVDSLNVAAAGAVAFWELRATR